MDPNTSLKLNSDFRRLYAKGKSAVSPCVVIYCRKNRLGHNRVGFTVSRKLGKAVVRNRVRRQLREIVRLNTQSFRSGFDLIVVARSRAVTSEYRRLERDVLHCMRELKLLLPVSGPEASVNQSEPVSGMKPVPESCPSGNAPGCEDLPSVGGLSEDLRS